MVSGDIRPVADVFAELKLDRVAVVKMNTEGGEYDLLPALIDTGLIKQIDRLTVQFHKYSDSQIGARDAVRAGLANPHDCVWDFPFIWEEWVRKAD